MESPSRPTDAQRWLRFTNVGAETIPPFAIVGPQHDQNETYDAIESNNDVDFALRLGRPHATQHGHDASLFYINGYQDIRPSSRGRCTQTGMMQALIGYPNNSPPAWGDGLSIDASQTKTPFYLVPGSGGYKFIDFDGCPKTTFRDSTRTDYQFQIGWIVPASQSMVLDGAIIKDSSTLTTLPAGGILTFSGRDNPELVSFGLSRSRSYSSEVESLQARGFHCIHTTGHYLLSFTARVRSTDSDINTNIASNLLLTCRTNRVGNTQEFKTADQVEALAAAGDLDEESADYIFHKLRVAAEDQPADTNLVEGETVEVHRHWQTVSGSTVLELTEGELLFIYNPTGYEIEVSSMSGTLVLLSGAGHGSISSSSASSSSSDEAGNTNATQLGGRISTVEVAVGTLESDLGTLEATATSQAATITSHTATLASHTTSIATNASGITTNASAIADHETRVSDLETFETSATTAIAGNASNISTNTTDIATNASVIGNLEAFQATATTSIAANASDIASLQTFQTTTEAIFAAAIADDTYTTAAGDEITTANGVVTGFTQGAVTLPGTAGTNTYFLQTNGAGGTAWAKVVHQNWSENDSGHLVPDTSNIRDIGTTSLKPHSLHLAGDAHIDGLVEATGLTLSATTSLGDVIAELKGWGLIVRIDSGDTEHDVNVSSGYGFSGGSTQRKLLALFTASTNSGMTKRLDASWSAGHGNGGMATGTVAANATYYIHLIENDSTGVCDVMFDTSGAATNIPSGYTRYCPVGRVRTDASSHIRYVQSHESALGGAYVDTQPTDGEYLKYDAATGRYVTDIPSGGSSLTTVEIDQTNSPYASSAGERVNCTITSNTEVDLPASPGDGDTVLVRLHSTSSGATVTIDPGAEALIGEDTLYIGNITKQLHDEIEFQFDGTRWLATARTYGHFDRMTLSADMTANTAGTPTLIPHDQSDPDQLGDLRVGSKDVIKRANFYEITVQSSPRNNLSDQTYYETFGYVNGTKQVVGGDTSSGMTNSLNAFGTRRMWLEVGDEVTQYMMCGQANKGAWAGSAGYTSITVREVK
ncbi:hypothetical protein Pan97_24590 [Bremerella volcania]|uniref:Uncharacterized protein n=1 Tax=Bremerella volcania TaxID=2527984 RepID=A0A518C870_9BACT|nr:hypothetical protein [Bremerella volcania]QDU75427.1 hypothetical protein Pan97_24590 [Bremerella volcania]